MAACRHRACGATFSGLTAFDRHLRWHKGPPWVSCRNPEDVGLVWSGISWGYKGLFPHPAGGGGIGPSSVAHKASGASS